ncbi:hypothetical protein QCA50_014629 [Cerrena zonata]|uniref:DNA damage-binding protein 1 n=1 Tax=Cerrena zonata TaxID=2478898 RepID=A0AAW0FS87_9APHY
MKLVTTFHSTSSVVGSLKCRLTPDSELEYLVIARPNRIEVSALTPDGLRPECELEIWGRVLALRSIPSPDAAKLLILTDHPDPYAIVLAFDPDSPTPSLRTLSSVSLHDRNAQHAEFCTDAIVSPDGEVAIISCYKGKLRVLSLDEGKILDSVDVAIPELNLISIAFIEYDTQYHLAMAHVDHRGRIQLLSKELDIGRNDISISTVPSELLPTTILLQNDVVLSDAPRPFHLIPVPRFQVNFLDHSVDTEGGVIVIGARSIWYFELALEHELRVKKEKRRRLENRKSSGTDSEKAKAKEKEKERESRKVKPKASVTWPWGEVTAVLPVDSTFRKILIGDKFGYLSLLTLDNRPSLTLAPIGKASPPTTLTHITSQFFYIGSHVGNSQLVRLLQAPASSSDTDTLPIPSSIPTSPPSILSAERRKDDDKERAKGAIIKLTGSYVEVLESFRNIAPIVDATSADIDGSGQPQLITCSGENSTGSINVLQNGADFVEVATLEGLTSVAKICPIRSRYQNSTHTHILFSSPHGSQIFALDEPGSLRRLDTSSTGLNTSLNTHAFTNIAKRTIVNGKSSYVDSSWVVQVTQKAVTLLDYDEALKVFHRVGHEWTPMKLNISAQELSIVAADVSPSQITVGIEGGHIAVLGANAEGQIDLLQFDSLHKEICSISCQSFDHAGMFTTRIAVSFWEDNTIALYGFQGNKLQLLSKSDPLPSLPNSVLLHNFGSGRKAKDTDYRPCVLAGLVDGSILTFSFRDNQLQDKKVFSLGGTPVQLSGMRY